MWVYLIFLSSTYVDSRYLQVFNSFEMFNTTSDRDELILQYFLEPYSNQHKRTGYWYCYCYAIFNNSVVQCTKYICNFCIICRIVWPHYCFYVPLVSTLNAHQAALRANICCLLFFSRDLLLDGSLYWKLCFFFSI